MAREQQDERHQAARRQETARRIERAGLELFARAGFDQVTVEEIAAAAGVSRATVFRYFGTKEDVLLADHRRQLDRARSLIRAEPDTADPQGFLRAAALAMAAELDEHREVLAVRLRAQSSARLPLPLALRIRSEFEVLVAEELARRRGRAAPLLSDWVTASSFVGAVASGVTLWARAGAPGSLVRVFERSLRRIPQVGAAHGR